MDKNTKSPLDEFIRQNGLEKLPEKTAFEHFTGLLVTPSHLQKIFSTEGPHVDQRMIVEYALPRVDRRLEGKLISHE